MCKKTNYNTPNPRMDNCRKGFISYLNRHGIKTYACCCGHGKYPMTVVCKSEITGKFFDLITGNGIPRKRKFYKRDKQGHYFIPEVSINAKPKKRKERSVNYGASEMEQDHAGARDISTRTGRY